MIICAIIIFLGVICVILGLIGGPGVARKHQHIWTTVRCVGIVLFIIGWVGYLMIIDTNAARQPEYEYVYNYCPHCGERLTD